MRKVRAAVLIVGVLFALFGTVASASASVTVSPAKVMLAVRRGAESTFAVTMSNDGTSPLRIQVAKWDFARDAKGKPQPVTQADARRFRGCASWMSDPTGVMMIPARGDAQVQVRVLVPADADWGSHSTYLQLSAIPAASTGGIGVAFAMNVLVVVTVIPEEGAVLASDSTPLLSQSVSVEAVGAPSSVNTSVPLRAVLVNSGNVHVNVSPRFDIMQNGKVVDSVLLKEFTLLPGDRYPLSASWEKPPMFGNYTLRFVAEADEGSPITKDATFWFVSWTLIAIVSCAILALAVAVVLFRKFVHIEIRRAEPQPVSE